MAPAASPQPGDTPAAAAIADGTLRLEFDSALRSRTWHLRHGAPTPQLALSSWSETEYLLLADGSRLDGFALERQKRGAIRGPHGEGRQLTLSGRSAAGVEKSVRIEMWRRYPGIALYRVSYRNLSPRALELRGWHNADLQLLPDGEAASGHAPQEE